MQASPPRRFTRTSIANFSVRSTSSIILGADLVAPKPFSARRFPPPPSRSVRMLLVIDNYDSFTYNLVQYLGELGEEPVVRRNDETTLDNIEANLPSRILISPG